jgi:hypothetical protein
MKEALSIYKALADETRLKILCALKEKEMYVELLSERLQLTPATGSFHMKKLAAAGLVETRREQYYTIYSLREEAFSLTLGEMTFADGEGVAAGKQREEMYRRKVIKAFMPYGYCETMPAQSKKRMIIYEEIFRRFERGATYTEQEVNEIISAVHSDFCTVRRAFIGMGWMTRSGGVYTVQAVE